MHRNVVINNFKVNIDSTLSDQEALLIQLCEYLFSSGFVYNDSTELEIEAGNSVIRYFFAQEADVIPMLVPRERINAFKEYLNNFGWSAKKLQRKIHNRILKSFDRLAKGNHHLFNIRHNISQGLRLKERHPLYDLLLFIETYYSLILEMKDKESRDVTMADNLSKKKYKLEDVMELREELKDSLNGRKLVKGFLNHIANLRGVSLKSLLPKEKIQDIKSQSIIFIRPSKNILSRKKLNENVISEISKAVENNFGEHDNYVNLKNVDDQGKQMEIFIEPDFEQLKDEFHNEIADEKIDNEFTEINLKEPNSSEINDLDYDEKNKVVKDKEIDVISSSILAEDNSKIQVNSKSLSSSELISEIDERSYDEFIEDEEDGLVLDDTEEDDVVFGSKKISQISMEKFVRQYPDSTLKFLLRRALDGRPLPSEIEEVYTSWEKRGLSRGPVKKYLLKIMGYSEIPDMPIMELLQIIRDRVYEISKKN